MEAIETEDIDCEHLISLVEAKPELWNKYVDTYKDRERTKNAWKEVCVALCPSFGDLDASAKNTYAKEVLKKWNNIRDCFARYKKQVIQNSRTSSRAKKIKKYVYFDKLQFLNIVYNGQETVHRKRQEKEGELSADTNLEDSTDALEVPHHSKSTTKARKRRKPDESEPKILKALEGDCKSTATIKPCSRTAFLQSLMPHLRKFDDEEFLQFQMGVLNVIGNIKDTKKAMHPHPYHFPHQQFPSYPQPQFVNPPTQFQTQQLFHTPNQPPFYRKKRRKHGQPPSTCTKMPTPNQCRPSSSGNKQEALRQELPSGKQPSPVSFYSSPESENSLSSNPAASSIADSI